MLSSAAPGHTKPDAGQGLGRREPVGAQKPTPTGVHCEADAKPVALLKVPPIHGIGEVDAGGQCEPASHGRQLVELESGWKKPAGQALHAAFSNPDACEPALHCNGAVAPSAHADPGGQGSHTARPVCR